jgi:GTP pyrophosphokinase
MVDRLKRRREDHGINVKGVSDMLVRFANCCHPIPGDQVIGFITRGRGITIHHKNCSHILKADPDRLVELSWEPSKDDVYHAKIRVTSVERKGVLADVSSIITQKDANIIQADVRTTMDNKGIALFTIEVENSKQLEDIMGSIKKVKNVLIVERL